jgi:hypothetical protein
MQPIVAPSLARSAAPPADASAARSAAPPADASGRADMSGRAALRAATLREPPGAEPEV